MTTSRIRRTCLLAATAMALAATFALHPAAAQRSNPPAVYTGIVKGVAVGGYDPVAYFTVGKPVPGKADITVTHEGATWRFASAANRDAFKAEPAKYAPQYGGHCAWAVGTRALFRRDSLRSPRPNLCPCALPAGESRQGRRGNA